MNIDGEEMLQEESAERILVYFGKIDELMRCSPESEQYIFAKYLNGDMDLYTALAQHEAEFSALRESFIQAHVDEAESICSLYAELVECEKKFVQFEEGIIVFQRRLADSADDMVKMQQQTVGLLRSIDNRRLASSKLSEVYTALQECDLFCNAITGKEVDQKYLENITELAKKLLFLSSNKELGGSAVDLETRPRLKSAALRAGSKLQRYFSREIATLVAAEDFASVQRQQRALLERSKTVFGFLKSYNLPVAMGVFREYGKFLSETFVRFACDFIHNFSKASALHAYRVDAAIIIGEDVQNVVRNCDSGSPGVTKTVAVSSILGAAGSVLSSEQKTSIKRPPFHDTLVALGAASFNDCGNFIIDTAAENMLENANCWVWHFLRLMQFLVNVCVSECNFVSQFFCTSTAENGFDEAEELACTVLTKTLKNSQGAILDSLPIVTDRQSTLAALRIVDMIKNHLCHLHDPVPLLLLSGIMEVSKSTLKGTLHTVMAKDQNSAQLLSGLQLSFFRLSLDISKADLRGLLEDSSYAATLGPHPIVCRFAQIAGELDLLNSAYLENLMVNCGDVFVYDCSISSILYAELELVLEFIVALMKRHENPLAQRLFLINNFFYILATWREMADVFSTLVKAEINQLRCAGPPANVACIESRLFKELLFFVDEYFKKGDLFLDLLNFAWEAEAALGSLFFVGDGSTKAPHTLETLPSSLNEEATKRAVFGFHQNWRAQLLELHCDVKKAVSSTMNFVEAIAMRDNFLGRCKRALEELIMREFAQTLVEANTKLHFLAKHFFSKNGNVHAKLISKTTLLQEVEKIL